MFLTNSVLRFLVAFAMLAAQSMSSLHCVVHCTDEKCTESRAQVSCNAVNSSRANVASTGDKNPAKGKCLQTCKCKHSQPQLRNVNETEKSSPRAEGLDTSSSLASEAGHHHHLRTYSKPLSVQSHEGHRQVKSAPLAIHGLCIAQDLGKICFGPKVTDEVSALYLRSTLLPLRI